MTDDPKPTADSIVFGPKLEKIADAALRKSLKPIPYMADERSLIAALGRSNMRLRAALEKIAILSEAGMPPDYRDWLTLHEKMAQIAREALADEES